MKKTSLFSIVFALVASTTAFAQQDDMPATSSTFPAPARPTENQLKPHIAVLAGVASAEGDYEASGEYGVDIGFQPYIPYGVGLLATHASHALDDGDDLDRTTVLIRGTYNFGGVNEFVKNSYVGVAAGAVIEDSETNFAAAPLAGFDLPLQEGKERYFSLGASAKYLAVVDSTDSFAIDGVLKYWY